MNSLGGKAFARLLAQRGIPYRDGERLAEWLSLQEARPDFCARPYGYPPFLAAVAGPWGPAPSRRPGGRPGAEGPDPKWLGRLVRGAAWRLRPYKQLGLAMVVVLDDPGTGGPPPGVAELIAIARALEDRRPYVSALLVSLPKAAAEGVGRTEQDPPLRARILHNPAAAVPLHLGVFSEPEDEQFGRVEERWVDLRTGAPPRHPEGPSP